MSHGGYSDFRSDTVTRPTPAMYEAIREAQLGDDVFADDPSVNELQNYAAALLGKESALFCPTGTMANQIAVRVHTRPGDEVIIEEKCHIYFHEQGGLAQLSGVQARTLRGQRGVVDLGEVVAAIRPVNDHYPRTSLFVMENTHNGSGGSVLPIEWMREASAVAKENGLSVHLDGARLCNAAAKSGVDLAEYASLADSVSLCLSKGLAAPAGTLLLGGGDFIRSARRVRKVYGGGMRQAGILAAAGLVALRDMRGRLLEDHGRAARLAERLVRVPGIEVQPPETNMVYVRWRERAAELARHLETRKIRVLAVDPHTLRFVTHKDIDDGDVDATVMAVAEIVTG